MISIFGVGELAKIMYRYVGNVDYFVADKEFIPESHRFQDIEVIEFGEGSRFKNFQGREDDRLFIPVSYSHVNKDREKIFVRAKIYGYRIESYIHQSAHVHPSAKIGLGTWIHPLVSIDPDVVIGKGCVFWSGAAHAGHSSVYEDFVWQTSGSIVCGQCSIGSRTFIGANAVVHPGLSIGTDCIIGSGAIITRDLPAFSVALEGRNNIISKKSWEISL
jgi:acetyltransferase-like isoleucine patch superfamily enzyme